MSRIKTSLTEIDNYPLETRQAVEERILKVAREGRLQCPQAMAIAKSLGVSTLLVGQMADQMGIRVSQCQLGCF